MELLHGASSSNYMRRHVLREHVKWAVTLNGLFAALA